MVPCLGRIFLSRFVVYPLVDPDDLVMIFGMLDVIGTSSLQRAAS